MAHQVAKDQHAQGPIGTVWGSSNSEVWGEEAARGDAVHVLGVGLEVDHRSATNVVKT